MQWPKFDCAIVGQNHRQVAIIRIDADKEQSEANVRLIASAPELLEALRAITNACEGDFFGAETNNYKDNESVGGGEDGDMCLTFGAIRNARAAITKAEGR